MPSTVTAPSAALRTLVASIAAAAALGLAAQAGAESLTTSASSAGSSASSAGSASSRGSSDSIRSSSDSSRDEHKVTEGEYRVIAIAPAEGRTDLLTVQLEPTADNPSGHGFVLDLPARALAATGPVAAGDRVFARHRSYGLEFNRVGATEPFFLVLADAWQADLQTRVVGR